jgi:translation elongation factor EF-1alpha
MTEVNLVKLPFEMTILDVFTMDSKVVVVGHIDAGSIGTNLTLTIRDSAPQRNFPVGYMYQDRKISTYAEAGELVALTMLRAYPGDLEKGQVLVEAKSL